MDLDQKLQQAISSLESLRSSLGDQVVDDAIAALLKEQGVNNVPVEGSSPRLRYVSVLFLDVVGSTKMERNMDPEDILQIMDAALVRFQDVIDEFGGRVLRFMGDGLIAIFGSPRAREDDARRAVLAGLKLQENCGGYEMEVKERWKLPTFQIRVGINTGQVITGAGVEAENSAIGMTTNIAKRMESLAPPGCVLISHETRQHIQNHFELEEKPPVEVKGVGGQIRTHLVLRAKPRQFYPRIHSVAGVDTQMVGREIELKRLMEDFQASFQESKAHLVTIVGDAGIGKSRLCDEFDRWVQASRNDTIIFKGRASHQSIRPYGLVHDMFANYYGIMDDDPIERVRERLTTGLEASLGNESRMKAHIIGAMLGIDYSESRHITSLRNNPKQLREQAQFYLTEYFSNLSNQNPIVFLLEDLHWSDPASLDIINLLARECTQQPIFIISTARPDFLQERVDWGQAEILGDTPYTQIDLHNLTSEQSNTLLRQIFQNLDQIPDAMSAKIVSTAEGNPFYIEELVKMLIDKGVIQLDPVTEFWKVENDRLVDLHVPATLTAVLQARFDRILPAEKKILQQAAVIGRVFWDRALQTIQSKDNPPRDELENLTRRELIDEHEDAVIDQTVEYSYRHALMREVVYDTILKSTKQTYHRQVADWLTGVTHRGGRSEEYAGVIAEHYMKAGMAEQACSWYLKAGELAKTQGAPNEALQFFNLANDFLPEGDIQRRWHILVSRYEILGWLGDQEARSAEGDTLVDLAREMGDASCLAEAYYRIGSNAYAAGDEHSAIKSLNLGLEVAESAGGLKRQALILSMKVACNTRLGNFEEAGRDAEAAQVIAELIYDDETLAQVLTNVALYYGGSGDLATQRKLFIQAVVIAHRRREKFGESIGLGNLGYNSLILGKYKMGQKALERALQISESIGAQRVSAYHRLNLGLSYSRTGQHKEGYQVLERAAAEMEKYQDKYGQGVCQTYIGLLLESDIKLERSQYHFNMAYEIMNELGFVGYANDALAGRARNSLIAGNIQDANELANKVYDYILQYAVKGMEFPILAYLTCIKVWKLTKDYDRVEECVNAGYDRLLELKERIRDPVLRESFIECVPEHKELHAEWHRRKVVTKSAN